MTTTENFVATLNGDAIRALQRREGMPARYLDDLRTHVAPLAAALCRRVHIQADPLLVGINGCQGSGKSTLAKYLAAMLNIGTELRTTVLSIDDFYLERSERQLLAKNVHPLLITRGVPGTHDLDLAEKTLDELLDSSRVEAVSLPAFDKATDDRKPRSEWLNIYPNPDVIIVEGWCVGCPPQSASEISVPENTLERDEDADGTWRRYVNEQLSNFYQPFFARLDLLIMLAAPDFDCVFGWRRQQEEELAASMTAASPTATVASELLSENALRRFISHYERLTRHQLKVLPPLADAVIDLGTDHRMVAHSGKLYA